MDSNQQRKRRLGALFEEIFIPDETDHVQKKLKNEVEKDENLIRLILDARSKAHNRLDSKKGNELQKIQELNEFKRRNLSGSVPKWPFTVVTRTDGDRVYVRTHSEEFEKKELEEISLKKSPHESILGDQRAAIWEGAREYMHKRLTAGGQQGEDATEEVAVQQVRGETKAKANLVIKQNLFADHPRLHGHNALGGQVPSEEVRGLDFG